MQNAVAKETDTVMANSAGVTPTTPITYNFKYINAEAPFIGVAGTTAVSSDNNGNVYGYYGAASSGYQGSYLFVYNNGVFTSISSLPPSPPAFQSPINFDGNVYVNGLTYHGVATASNRYGDFTGYYEDSSHPYQDPVFVYKNGYFTTITDGGSPIGITDAGQVIGNFRPHGGNTYAFIATPMLPQPVNVNEIKFRVSQDAYKGDAQFIVKVNGEQVGDVQTVHASHATGQWDTITLQSTVSEPTQVQIQFINDLYEWSPSADRNLYVQSLTFDGRTFDAKAATNTAGHNVTDAAALLGNGTLTFQHVQDTLKLRVAEDNYMGDAKFIVTVDGVQVGGVQTAHASHAEGQWEDITLTGDFAHANRVGVQFINDANGGPGLDRNLYIDSINLNGTTYKGSDASVPHGLGQTAYSAELWTNASAVFSTGPDSLVFRVAEDAYKGDAQFIIKVDGQQVGGIQTAHASHASGQWEDITLHGSFAGANHVSVEFINDANGGAGQDRNLYIDSISLDGHVVRGTAATVAKGIGQTVYSAELWTNGSADFNVSGLHHTDLMA